MTQPPPPYGSPPPPWPPGASTAPGAQQPGGWYAPQQQQPPAWWAPPATWPLPTDQMHGGRRPRRTRVAVLAVAIVALLLADVGGLFVVHHQKGGGSAGSLAADVPALEDFVARDRGMPFKRKVKVIVMSRADLTKYVQDLSGGPDDETKAEASLYQAVGLIDDAGAYVTHLQEEEAADVGGLYRNGTDTIRIAAEASTPYSRSVVAHELTHALDDQYFPLRKVQSTAIARAGTTGDENDAFSGLPLPDLLSGIDGLLEGDAERVRDDYLAQLSPADQQAEQDEEVAAAKDVPFDDDDRTLAPLTYLPYIEGIPYTQALLKEGQAKLDATFADPPVSTRQILHPGAAAPSGDPKPATPPGDVLGTGSFGEAGLAVVLGEASRGDIKEELAVAWRDDRVTVSTDGGKSCVSWALVLDGSSDAIAAKLRTKLPSAQVSATSDGLAVMSCR